MTQLVDCRGDDTAQGLDLAVRAVRDGHLIVLPTDTVYGLGADAFSVTAVNRLLAAKGRGRDMPVPVLVADPAVLAAVALIDNDATNALVEAFWPGALTLVCREQPSLHWDLGDTAGTVAVRSPEHPLALDVLRRTGPLAVSSANRSGQPPARTATAAQAQLGASVAVYLEAGPSGDPDQPPLPSSIVDVTGPTPRLLRAGAISLDRLREVVPTVLPPPEVSPAAPPEVLAEPATEAPPEPQE